MCAHIIFTSTVIAVAFLLQHPLCDLKGIFVMESHIIHTAMNRYIIYIYNTLNVIHNFINNIVNDLHDNQPWAIC